jgi:glucose-6-phosphate 1-dehydrogenase
MCGDAQTFAVQGIDPELWAGVPSLLVAGKLMQED